MHMSRICIDVYSLLYDKRGPKNFATACWNFATANLKKVRLFFHETSQSFSAVAEYIIYQNLNAEIIDLLYQDIYISRSYCLSLIYFCHFGKLQQQGFFSRVFKSYTSLFTCSAALEFYHHTNAKSLMLDFVAYFESIRYGGICRSCGRIIWRWIWNRFETCLRRCDFSKSLRSRRLLRFVKVILWIRCRCRQGAIRGNILTIDFAEERTWFAHFNTTKFKSAPRKRQTAESLSSGHGYIKQADRKSVV